MRLSQNPPTLLSLLLVVLSHTEPARAVPLFQDLGFGFLHARQYGNCGADNQYTCSAGQGCYTTNDIAYCSATAAEAVGGWYTSVYTTVYTETDYNLRTSTITTSWGAPATTTAWAPPPTSAAVCGLSQPQCGALCCASTQGCFTAGSCTDIATAVRSYTSMSAAATSASPYIRPTSSGGLTTTLSASTTVPFIPPATASGSSLPITSNSTSRGLSGGAIAGIVIGTIAGIILLLLICFCCILKAGFDGILAIFGLGKKKRRSTERIETVERYSRHGGSGGSRRDTHTGWFGTSRPARVDESRKKTSSGFGGLGAVGVGLLALAALLGLKRRHDKKKVTEVSEISSSYYTDSYTGTSASK